jgi:arginine/ornithine transport system permease protein
MSGSLLYRRVILPSAFRRALPAYANEVIFMLHGSAIASVITVVDLTGVARIINSRYYSPYEAFITAGVFYMGLTFAIVWGFKVLEKRWHAHLRPRET